MGDGVARFANSPEEGAAVLREILGSGEEKTGGEAGKKARRRLQGRELELPEPSPWPEPVDGADVLEDVVDTLRRFVVMAGEQGVAEALWIVHTFLMSQIDISPILAITSPTPRCGKTRNEILLKALVCRPLLASSLTPAAIFRTIEKARPCLLIDELDTFLAVSDELRGILNSGHTRDAAFVIRAVGDDHEPRLFSTWAPKALAMIGRLPPTLKDRSIEIRLERKKKGEEVPPLRAGTLASLEPLRRKVARFAADIAEFMAGHEPEIPGELNDRAADNWTPLLAIADAAGGEWPERARRAALALSGADTEEGEVGVLLLEDLKAIFEERGADRLPSAEIVEALVTLEDRPWPEWRHGKPLTVNGLARLLRPFGIKSKQYREGLERFRGYELEDLQEAFSRYIPIQSVTPVTSQVNPHFQAVTTPGPVTDAKCPLSCNVTAVTDRIPEKGVFEEKEAHPPAAGEGADEDGSVDLFTPQATPPPGPGDRPAEGPAFALIAHEAGSHRWFRLPLATRDKIGRAYAAGQITLREAVEAVLLAELGVPPYGGTV